MTYDRELADRIRGLVAGADGVVEQPMFGGLAFLLNGHMAVAASGKDGLMVRVDPAEAEHLIDGEHVRPMVMGGREMRRWLRVGTAVLDEQPRLADWVTRGLSYARSLPNKPSTRRKGAATGSGRPARA